MLVIEDDASINEVVATFLSKRGFVCTQAFSGSEARLLLERDSSAFDLVITDLMLPGLTGNELVGLIRASEHGTQVPIIVTSALDKPEHKVDLFNLGADDYLTKPFDLDELLARITVQLRHKALAQAAKEGESASGNTPAGADTNERAATDKDQEDASVITFREWKLSPEARSLEAAGEPIKLTRIEYNIIETLMHRPTKVFTKRELFELAWSEECFIEEKAINVHVSNIRSKLKDSGTSDYIQTVWGVGFKLAHA